LATGSLLFLLLLAVLPWHLAEPKSVFAKDRGVTSNKTVEVECDNVIFYRLFVLLIPSRANLLNLSSFVRTPLPLSRTSCVLSLVTSFGCIMKTTTSHENTSSSSNHDVSIETSHTHIGIDFGTTNSAAAVYVRNRGRPKWMRLQTTTTTPSGQKIDRIVPTVLVLISHDYYHHHHHHHKMNQTNSNNQSQLHAIWHNVHDLVPNLMAAVGTGALLFLKQLEPENDPDILERATIRSIKRKLLLSSSNTESNTTIHVTPLGMTSPMTLEMVLGIAMFLRAIKHAADQYLQSRTVKKKQFQLPGQLLPIQYCVIGVPATANLCFRKWIVQAATKAGFVVESNNTTANITLTESTAAAMAYGLTVSSSSSTMKHKNILVFDMGGGTTDVTIAEQQPQQPDKTNPMTANEEDKEEDENAWIVQVTHGANIGGEDMDQAIAQHVLRTLQANDNDHDSNDDQHMMMHPRLLQACRRAKEELCGDAYPNTKNRIIWQGRAVEITGKQFETIVQPIVNTAKNIVEQAMDRYKELQQSKRKNSNSNIDSTVTIQEVIVIGGGTFVPSIRAMLQEYFRIELCTSVHPMSAVAQGCSIAAAAHVVPRHELRSALMLDTNPHPIGVLTTSTTTPDASSSSSSNKFIYNFVEILHRDETLPAAHSARFVLADLHQPGVTVRAVEKIGSENSSEPGTITERTLAKQYNDLGEFTFLLHRLTTQQERILLEGDGIRSVEIGMTLKENGEFIVSIFDPLDPEHLRKKEDYIRAKQQQQPPSTRNGDAKAEIVLGYTNENDDRWTSEQILLILGLIVVSVLYLVAKIAFADPAKIQKEIV
jgi:molecular chaperone DnaK (HSP70)